MAKTHSSLTGADLHNPKGIGVETHSTSSLIISQSAGSHTGAVTSSAMFIPGSTNTYDLGSATKAWRKLYVITSSIEFVNPAGTTIQTLTADSDGISIGSGQISGSAISGSGLMINGGGNITGDLTIGGNMTFGDADTDSVSITADLTSNLIPNADATYDLGSSTKGWNDLHLGSGGVINLDGGDVTLTHSANTITVAGGTLAAAAITGTTIDASTDFTIGSTVITDDSIVMTPSTSDTITFSGATNGVLNITTVDNAGTAGDINLIADGQIEFRANDAAGHIFDINGTNQVTITDGLIAPVLNADIDLGTDALEFGDIWIDGTANLDTVDIDAGAIDGTTIGANSAAAGTFTNLQVTTDVNIDDSGGDGAMDGVIIGAATPASATFTSMNTTGLTTLGDASGDTLTINAATINPTNIAAGTDNTVVVYNGSTLVTDEIDSRVWGSTLVATDGSGTNNELATWSDSAGIIGESNLTFDGSKLTVTGNAVVTSHISSSASITGSNLYSSGILDVASTGTFGGNVTAVGSFIIGSADMDETDLEKLDGITNGAGAANKALVLDGNADIASGLRNITLTGTLSDGNYTFDTSGNVSGLGTVGCGAITSTGNLAVTGTITGDTSLTLDSTTLTTAELGVLDSVTPGTAAASKALVLDASKDIGTIRNLTIDGTFSDGNYTFDTSGNVSSLGTIGSGNITSTGTVQGTVITATTGFAPDAQDGAYLGTSALQFSDLFLADAAVIAFGDDGDVTLTHVADTGLLLTDNSGVGTTQLQFGDSGTYISQLADGTLGLVADTEIDISATTIDINGAVAFNGALTGITNITLSGTLSDGNYTFDTNGNVSGLGTLSSGQATVASLICTAAGTFGGGYGSTGATISTAGVIQANGNIETAGSFVIGSADMDETDLEKLDGITNGTAAANKAVVLDGSKNIATIGTVGCGAITSTGTSVFNDITVGGGYGSTGTTISSAGILSTNGAATFASDVTIYGNLHVTGSTVTVDSTTLNIADKNITIGSGSTSSSTMNEAGLDFGLNASVLNLRYRHSDTRLTSSVDLGAPQLHSSIATGTAPLTVQSTTVVSNLNADKLDGQEGSYYTDFSNMTVTSGEIVNAMIGDDEINSEHYAAGSIDNEHIADDAINSEHYADLSIDLGHLAADSVDGSKIVDDAIDSEHYAAASIDNEHIADDAINSEHYAAGSIDNEHIADDAINSEHYAALSIDLGHLAADSVDGSKIVDDAIDSEHYAALSIDLGHLAADSVDGSKIVDDAINSEHYAAASIDTAHIAADNITGALIADSEINSEHYVDASIDDEHLSDGVATGLAGAGMTATSGVMNVIASTGITVNADNITTNDGQIVHDSLSGYVADEHIAHSGVTLTAGTGLNGGGTIADNRTFTVDAAQTVITSIYATDLIMGEDSQTAIDFKTPNNISFKTNNAEDFLMVPGGTFHANADVVAYSSTVASDMSLKENITDTKYGLSDIMKLRGVDFDWKREDMGHSVGVLAQEVEAVIPEIVKEHDGLNGRERFKSVDYNKLVPVLIESIKELKKEIDELKQIKN